MNQLTYTFEYEATTRNFTIRLFSSYEAIEPITSWFIPDILNACIIVKQLREGGVAERYNGGQADISQFDECQDCKLDEMDFGGC